MNEGPILHQNATERDLAIGRYCLFGIWIVRLALDPLERLGELPLSVFRPIAPVMYFPETWQTFLMRPDTLWIFRLATIGILALAAFGFRFLTTGLLSCVALSVYQATVRGYGHVNHAEIIPLIAVYILTAFAWADHVERTKRPACPLIAVVLVLCLSYAFVGAYRLSNGGVGVFFTNGIERSAILNSNRTSWFNFGLGDFLLENQIVQLGLRLGFIFVTLAEILAPFCLVSKRCRIGFLLVIFPFHLLTMLTMHIAFFENLLLLGLLVEFRRPKAAKKGTPESLSPTQTVQ